MSSYEEILSGWEIPEPLVPLAAAVAQWTAASATAVLFDKWEELDAAAARLEAACADLRALGVVGSADSPKTPGERL